MNLSNRIFPHPRGADVWGYLVDLDGMTVEEAEAAGREHGAACAKANTSTMAPAGGIAGPVGYAWHYGVWHGYDDVMKGMNQAARKVA